MNKVLAFLKKYVWGIIAAFVTLLLGALGIQTKRLKSAKQKTEDEKRRADEAEKAKQKQQEVVRASNEVSDGFRLEAEEVVQAIVPEIKKVSDIPKEEQKELSDPVKEAAKAQVERINARRKKK